MTRNSRKKGHLITAAYILLRMCMLAELYSLLEPKKNEFIQKFKFSHYLFTRMSMENRVNFCSPKNISGASWQNSIAAFSLTT